MWRNCTRLHLNCPSLSRPVTKELTWYWWEGRSDLCYSDFIVFLSSVKLSEWECRTLSSALWIAGQQEGITIAEGLGVPCVTHSESQTFGSSQVPHQILNLLSVTSSSTARPVRVTLFTAGGLLLLDRLLAKAVNSVLVGGVTTVNT